MTGDVTIDVLIIGYILQLSPIDQPGFPLTDQGTQKTDALHYSYRSVVSLAQAEIL